MHRAALGSRLFTGYFWELLGQGFVDLGMGRVSVRLTGGRFWREASTLTWILAYLGRKKRDASSGATASVPA